jgi:hypothetical protein
MTSKQNTDRRQLLNERETDREAPGTPIELPMDAKAPGRSLEDQIQEQIAIQIAKKRPG